MATIKLSKNILICLCIFISINTSSAISFVTAPYLQHLTPNEVTIMWIVDMNNNYGWVMYGDNNQQRQKAVKIDKGMLQAYSRIHKVTIKNLQPGTTYSYQVFSREITATANTSASFGDTIRSKIYSFTTPGLADTHTSAVIFNDTHNNEQIIEKLIALPEIPNFDFAFFIGDILDAIPDERTILNYFIIPCANLFASNKPFMSVRGNHEDRNAFARHYFDYVQMGDDNSGHYSFTRGPVFFIVLDSGEDKEDENVEYSGLNAFSAFREQEVPWLKQQLESDAYKQAKYRIVFMHIPTHTNTTVERFSMTDCRRLFEPLFNQYKIDALISGHTHQAGILQPDENHQYPIIIGGGKNASSAVMTLTADEHRLEVNIYGYYGTKLFTYDINK